MPREKILYVIRPAEGGMKEHLKLLVDYFRQLYDVTVACPRNNSLAGELVTMGVRVVPLPLEGGFKPWLDRECIRILKDLILHERMKLVHLHGYKAGLVGRLAARMCKVPVVLTVHNYLSHDRISCLPKNFFYSAERLLSRWTWRYITVSRALAGDLVNQFGISGDKIITIYNGLHPDSFRQLEPGKILKGVRGPVVGTIARLAPQKGIDCFLRAAAGVSKVYPEAQYLVVGDGPLMGELQVLAARIGLSGRVSFLGHRRDVYSLLQIMDVFVLPSRTEGLSFTLLEALAVGRPVVASNVGGVPEIINDGVNGLLVPPGDPQALSTAIVVLLENRDRAEKMAAASQQLVLKKFSAEKMLQKIGDLYRAAPALNHTSKKGVEV